MLRKRECFKTEANEEAIFLLKIKLFEAEWNSNTINKF